MAKFISVSEISTAARAVSIVHFEIQYGDADATFSIPVKAGTFVHEAGVVTTTGFTSTSPSIKVGISGTLEGLIQAANVTLGSTSSGLPVVSSAAAANTFRYGLYFPTDSNILVTWVQGTGTKTAGCLKGFIKLSNVQYDGILPPADGQPLAASSY
jgi:hypothetical protein